MGQNFWREIRNFIKVRQKFRENRKNFIIFSKKLVKNVNFIKNRLFYTKIASEGGKSPPTLLRFGGRLFDFGILGRVNPYVTFTFFDRLHTKLSNFVPK